MRAARDEQIAKNEQQLDTHAKQLEQSGKGPEGEATARAGREAVAAVSDLQTESSLLALTLSGDFAARQKGASREMKRAQRCLAPPEQVSYMADHNVDSR